MRLLERIEVRTPIYHVNQVAAAESGLGMRSFSDKIPVLPEGNPDQLTLALVHALMETDVKRGIEALAAVTLPKIRAGRLPGTGKEAKSHV